MKQRLEQQIQFLLEIDKLKAVLRQSHLVGVKRRENSAEHSWHVALMAMILAEYANEPIDILKVVKMLLIHDLVEIDAGDTYMYLSTEDPDQAQREQQAADRLFSLLPTDQAVEFRAVWDEFEAHSSSEARYAKSLDRLMPLLHNYHTQGQSWQEHQVKSDLVLERNAYMAKGADTLWEYAQQLIKDAVDKGYLDK